ncbi:hypothetical protein K3162_07755 [Qipengyuania xiapuensis]|uniref:DUF2157 domain-containing protein n=1 Tax=Qipengyuania xiapuensis TaxID=2867236 RepID=A0ABX8ZRS5_9SPHN|nr:hypothetical protein [Qipengyuania xiapuensis]QZD91471.1 hypothetical protein K3162_07755 [Qipengyuania xiapuensis]
MNTNADIAAQRRDEEDARLVTGAADILAGIASLLGLVALGAALAVLGPFVGPVIAAAAAGLAIPLVKQRNFAFSGIVLAASFAVGVFVLASIIDMASGLVVAGAMAWFWHAYRVPFAGALVVAAPVATLILGMGEILETAWGGGGPLQSLAAGIILFTAAMAVDMSDPERETRRSGIAFWLHIFAAPCLVHGIFLIGGFDPSATQPIAAIPVLAIVALLALVALVIDRRPLLASSIGYVAYALASLGEGLAIETRLIAVSLTLGIGILALAAFWSPLRRAALLLVPSALKEKLPAAGAFVPPPKPVAPETPAEEEPVRLVSGFNDIFVVMGTLPVAFGAWIVAGVWLYQSGIVTRGALSEDWLWRTMTALLIPGVAIWLVAEFFVRVRRMAFPAIVLAGQFAFVAFFVGGLFGYAAINPEGRDLSGFRDGIDPLGVVIACLVSALLNVLFAFRHRVPFALAMAAAALLPMFFIDLLASTDPASTLPEPTETSVRIRLLLAGALAAGLGVWLDLSDRERRTQSSDTAFWLHMLASLLLVPNLFHFAATGEAVLLGAVVIFLGLAIFALAVNRRAGLIVGLPFLAWALGDTFEGFGSSSLAMLVFSGLVLWAAIKWQELRAALFAWIDQDERSGI